MTRAVAVKAARKRQTPGQRRIAGRESTQRYRKRLSWPDRAKAILGTNDIDDARIRLYEDSALVSRLLADLDDVPPLLRLPNGKFEPDPKGYAVHVSAVEPQLRIAEAVAHLSADGATPGHDDGSPERSASLVVSLKSQYKQEHRRSGIDRAADADWDSMATEAAVMLAANRVAVERQDRNVSIGSATAAKRFCPYGSAERMGEQLKAAYDAYGGSYDEADSPPVWEPSGDVSIPAYHNRLFTVIDAGSAAGDWESDWLFPENGV